MCIAPVMATPIIALAPPWPVAGSSSVLRSLPASVTLTETGGGSYLITVVGGAAQAAIPNRYLFRVADSAAGEDIGETRVYLYGDFP